MREREREREKVGKTFCWHCANESVVIVCKLNSLLLQQSFSLILLLTSFATRQGNYMSTINRYLVIVSKTFTLVSLDVCCIKTYHKAVTKENPKIPTKFYRDFTIVSLIE